MEITRTLEPPRQLFFRKFAKIWGNISGVISLSYPVYSSSSCLKLIPLVIGFGNFFYPTGHYYLHREFVSISQLCQIIRRSHYGQGFCKHLLLLSP